MTTLYEDSEVLVKQGLFSSWKVILKATGTTISPPPETKETMGLVWIKVARRKGYSAQQRRFAEATLMRLFAEASIDPSSREARYFNTLPHDELIKIAYGELL